MNFDRELREFKARRHGLLASDTNTSELFYIKNMLSTIDAVTKKADKIEQIMNDYFASIDVDDDEAYKSAIKNIEYFEAKMRKKRNTRPYDKDGHYKHFYDMIVGGILTPVAFILNEKKEKLKNSYEKSYDERYKDQIRFGFK